MDEKELQALYERLKADPRYKNVGSTFESFKNYFGKPENAGVLQKHLSADRNYADVSPMVFQDPNKYRTKLNPQEEKGYLDWFSKVAKHKGWQGTEATPQGQERVYDMRGFYKKYPELANDMLGGDKNAHFTDEFKTPSHPTFSDESIYHSDQTPGGQWQQKNKQWYFVHSPYTAKHVTETANYLQGSSDKSIWDNDIVVPSVTIKPKQ